MATEDKIWYEDPIAFLMDAEDALRILPNKSMTLNDQLNAAFRFSLYFSIIVFIVKRDMNVFFFTVFVGIMTVIIHKHEQSVSLNKKKVMEHLNVGTSSSQKHCILPSKHNPFMNVLGTDYTDFPNRPSACSPMSVKTQTAMRKNYELGTVKDVDDVFNRRTGERQFYTTPSTTIPSDQTSFAKWLYETKPTCKERSMQCTRDT